MSRLIVPVFKNLRDVLWGSGFDSRATVTVNDHSYEGRAYVSHLEEDGRVQGTLLYFPSTSAEEIFPELDETNTSRS